MKQSKKYSAKQIKEAIDHWQKVLEKMNADETTVDGYEVYFVSGGEPIAWFPELDWAQLFVRRNSNGLPMNIEPVKLTISHSK